MKISSTWKNCTFLRLFRAGFLRASLATDRDVRLFSLNLKYYRELLVVGSSSTSSSTNSLAVLNAASPTQAVVVQIRLLLFE
jgi:ABC-type microcin C transport system duplicated ATPase subunit YejF